MSIAQFIFYMVPSCKFILRESFIAKKLESYLEILWKSLNLKLSSTMKRDSMGCGGCRWDFWENLCEYLLNLSYLKSICNCQYIRMFLKASIRRGWGHGNLIHKIANLHKSLHDWPKNFSRSNFPFYHSSKAKHKTA